MKFAKRVLGLYCALALASLVSTAQSTGGTSGQPPNTPAPAQNPLRIALLRWYKANLTGTKFTVGNQPYGVCFDGANIWSANYADGTVSKIRAADGTNLGTFTVGMNPVGVVFDGANVWVSNSSANTVTKLRASDGTTLGTFNVGKGPWWMAFDGQYLWIPNGIDNTVDKLRPADGKIQCRAGSDCCGFRR